MRICADDQDLSKKEWTEHVKSIKVPPHTKVMLYTEKAYQGRKVLISQSENCMDLYFSFIKIQGPGFHYTFHMSGFKTSMEKPRLVRHGQTTLLATDESLVNEQQED